MIQKEFKFDHFFELKYENKRLVSWIRFANNLAS
jgi:hypothetical protein